MDVSCKWIIGGMAVAIVGMAGYIVKQHIAERAILREWINSMRESKSLLDLVGEVNKNRPPTGG
jgi:hypothetical protein